MASEYLSVRHLPWMPVHIERLRRSRAWRRAKRDKALAFVLWQLWMASWQSDEAGTLEDDDELLADLTDCDDDEWAGYRERALEGWERLPDGRIRHPFIVELAEQAMSHEERRKEAQKKRRQRERGHDGTLGDNDTRSLIVPQRPIQEEKTGQDKTRENTISENPVPRDHTSRKSEPTRAEGSDAGFDQFWKIYPRRLTEAGRVVKLGKAEALKAWRALPVEQKRQAYRGVSQYAEAAGSKPVDPQRYLKRRLWDGLEVESAARTVAPDKAPPVDKHLAGILAGLEQSNDPGTN